MLTDKELDEIEARLARATVNNPLTRGIGELTYTNILADAVTLLAEVRRSREYDGRIDLNFNLRQ